MRRVVLIGASGHGRVVADVIEKRGEFEIAGFVDADPALTGCFGYPALGADEILPELIASGKADGVLITVGDNWTRARIAARLAAASGGVRFVKTVHPSAVLARGVTIGEGSVVMAGAVLNSNAVVGRHCIVNTRASLDHDSRMEDFSSLGPNAATGGNVVIGEYSAVAISATVLHGVSIGAHTVVGASATVIADLRGGVVAFGTPAKVIRERQPGDGYL